MRQSANALPMKVIEATNYRAAAIHFVLDGDETCNSKHGEDCLFSSDCSEPVHGICVKSNAELGAHKLEAFVNGQHLVAWVNVTNPDTTGTFKGGTGDCSVQDEDGKLCHLPLAADLRALGWNDGYGGKMRREI